jgi:hypothetical protein
MKGRSSFLMLTSVVMIYSACTSEQFSHNLYEGGRIQNEALKPTPYADTLRGKGKPMSYDQYGKERQETIDK